ncbi:MAG TPA: DUF1559 domain-containing protein [Planctomycetaceae bacterium]|jgi:hypothetical protein|nr:DUF1559 domain-containing protein [Planctomycetaceae bacterium]
MLTVQTFSISGGASVMEVPTNGANQVKYTVGFNDALTAGESASVTVNQALGSVAASHFTTTPLAALATAATNVPGVSFNTTTDLLTFSATGVTTSASNFAGSAVDVTNSADVSWHNPTNTIGNTPTTFAEADTDKHDTTDQLRLTNFGFNVPAGATISGITATLVTTGSNDPIGGAGIQLTKNGTTTVGSAPAATSGWSSGTVVIGGASSLWGTTWTPADINSGGFGLLVQPTALSSGEVFRIYTAKIVVSYSTTTTQPPSSLSFTATVNDDQIVEGNQTYSVNLSHPTTTDPGGAALGTSSVTTTLIDNDIAFSIAGGTSVNEDPTIGGNQVSYTISYAGTLGPGQRASVDVAQVLGVVLDSQFSTDAIAGINAAVANTPGVQFLNNKTLQFTSGAAASLTFTMSVVDDQVAQGNQTYSISLSNPQTISPSAAVITTGSVQTTVIDDQMDLVADRTSKLSTMIAGLEQYRAIYGRFPVDDVASLFDANGNPLLSWRVYILPFIGYTSLFQQFNLTQPWNSPQNLSLLSQMPEIFRSRGLNTQSEVTGFRMFQGNGAFQYGSTADFSNLSTVDAPQQTLLIFETMPQNAEFWTEPDEIPFNPANPLAGLTPAPDFFLAATASKEIKEINPSVAPQTFAAFATWDGHEILSDAQYANLYVNWDATDNATISTQKLQAIYQALLGFENTYDAFPPGSNDVPASWIDPTTGMPYLSWRVYVLPFLGYTDLFNQFHLDEPWNSPNNIQLLGDMPQEFRSRGLSPGTTLSAFKLIVGPDAYNVAPAGSNYTGPRWQDMIDGRETTISVVELTADQAVPWTQWNEIPYSAANPLSGLGTIPSDGLRTLMWDGSVHTISPNATGANLGIFETYNQQEVFGPTNADNAFTDWPLADTTTNRANKLAAIALAMHNYRDVYFSFPLGAGEGADWDPTTGQPYLSWRVYLLPFLGYNALFEQFHLNEPWNSPNNIQLLNEMPEIFRTRGLPDNTDLSAFKLLVGNGAYTYFTSSTDPNQWHGPRLADVTDGTANTFGVIELLPDQAVEWTRPDDIPFDPANPLAGLGTIPADGLLVSMLDGSVHTINPAVTPQNFAKFATINGGEIFGPTETSNVFLDWQTLGLQHVTTDAGAVVDDSATKLKQIMIAMHNYHDVNNSFPVDVPLADVDPSTGLPYLSWRVYLLPYLGYGDLFSQFHLNEPWNSPNNIQLLNDMPEVFRSRGLPSNATVTGFQVFMGPGAYSYTTITGVGGYIRGPRIRDVIDGTSNTIGVFETGPQNAVAWTRPDGDITFNPANPLAGLTNPGDYYLAAMLDGSVRSFDPALDASTFDEYVTFAGGEPLTYSSGYPI